MDGLLHFFQVPTVGFGSRSLPNSPGANVGGLRGATASVLCEFRVGNVGYSERIFFTAPFRKLRSDCGNFLNQQAGYPEFQRSKQAPQNSIINRSKEDEVSVSIQ